MPTPISASAAPLVGGPSTSFSVSSNTSSNAFIKYHTHTQVLQGMWTRKWVYDSHATGVPPSGPPVVLYSYVDVHVKESVIEEFESASHASGGFQQPQDIDYWSDSSAGGWGVSGQFWTKKAGIIRAESVVTDTEDSCDRTWNVEAAKMPGAYDPTLDTSGNFNSQFLLDVVTKAQTQCPRFITGLVTI